VGVTDAAAPAPARPLGPGRVCTVVRYKLGMPGPTKGMLRRDSRQRAAVASALRADHRSWREVARALGYRSVGAAQAAVKAHLDREYRQPHEQTVWEQIEAVKLRQRVLGDQLATATLEGDVDRIVMLNKELARNGDQLAKLTGTYAPDRQRVDVSVDATPSAVSAQWLRQITEAAAAAVHGGQPAALASAAEVIDAEVIER
jgi:hypothetical protein